MHVYFLMYQSKYHSSPRRCVFVLHCFQVIQPVKHIISRWLERDTSNSHKQSTTCWFCNWQAALNWTIDTLKAFIFVFNVYNARRKYNRREKESVAALQQVSTPQNSIRLWIFRQFKNVHVPKYYIGLRSESGFLAVVFHRCCFMGTQSHSRNRTRERLLTRHAISDAWKSHNASKTYYTQLVQ